MFKSTFGAHQRPTGGGFRRILMTELESCVTKGGVWIFYGLETLKLVLPQYSHCSIVKLSLS